ncbi:MAG: NAD(P)/FAD-dependent oxidoreductase [Vicinamibacterales bacterium]
MSDVDLAIVGGGAAGLMTAITAGRAARERGRAPRIVLVDGARTLGAKILVSGGGRCNVTHVAVSERDFNGSTPAAIRRVLRRFPASATVAFFAELGVPLVEEPTGKLFPASNRARDVLHALLGEAGRVGVEIRHPWRVVSLAPGTEGFTLVSADEASLRARRVVVATGGRSLPKSGSDGSGYDLVASVGHTVTPTGPALVPLCLDASAAPLMALSGLSTTAMLEVRRGTGRRLHRVRGDVLFTHFGVSGPAVLDISRHFLTSRRDDPSTTLVADWLSGEGAERVNAALRSLGGETVGSWLRARVPERLTRVLCERAGVSPGCTGHELSKVERTALVRSACEMPLPVTGDRGYAFAEVTSGGVPLKELRLESMESRLVEGLYLAGEICDVDGRIGGFNFQWAWASGYVAGVALGAAPMAPLVKARPDPRQGKT